MDGLVSSVYYSVRMELLHYGHDIWMFFIPRTMVEIL
jgi:hypothetical protein